MEEKNEVVKQKTVDLIVPNEQQFYTDVYSILQQVREKAYNNANGIMTYAYWYVRVLERNIKSGYYKRMLYIQLPDKENKVLEFVKDPFVLEFIGITPDISQLERDLETAIINNLQKFLMEMGKELSFVQIRTKQL